MSEKHLKKCSASLAIRKMQIKTIQRVHLTPVKIDKIKDTSDNLCWGGLELRKPSSIAGGSANLLNHYGDQYGKSQNIGS